MVKAATNLELKCNSHPGVVDDKGYRPDEYEVLYIVNPSLSDHLMTFEMSETYEQMAGTWTFLIFEED